jgi:hypothetical protein
VGAARVLLAARPGPAADSLAAAIRSALPAGGTLERAESQAAALGVLASGGVHLVVLDAEIGDHHSAGAVVRQLLATAPSVRLLAYASEVTAELARGAAEAGAVAVMELRGGALVSPPLAVCLAVQVAAVQAHPVVATPAPPGWWGRLPPVQQAAVAVALAALLGQVIQAVLEQVGPLLQR